MLKTRRMWKRARGGNGGDEGKGWKEEEEEGY